MIRKCNCFSLLLEKHIAICYNLYIRIINGGNNVDSKKKNRFLKILKVTGAVLVIILIILLIVRFIGKLYYNRIPDGGINETLYIDVNGQQQWLNIYSEDKNNPILLYLHGGPGNATSFADWKVLRKLAEDYTVVNWDQRNSGLTLIHDPQDTEITPDLMRQDIDRVVDYILDYSGKNKLTLMGMSWGSMYAIDYASRQPENVECLICLSLALEQDYIDEHINNAVRDYVSGKTDFRTAVDTYGYDLFLLNSPFSAVEDISLQKKFYEGSRLAYLELSEGDEKYHALAEKFDPSVYVDSYHDQSDKKLMKKAKAEEATEIKLMKKYGYYPFIGLLDDTDISPVAAIFFNPYYSLGDWVHFKYEGYDDETIERIFADFKPSEIKELEMPFYVLQGSLDCHSGADRKYFDQVKAPYKEFHIIKGGHVSTMTQSEKLASFIHMIAENQQNYKSAPMK